MIGHATFVGTIVTPAIHIFKLWQNIMKQILS